jgi:hypothetical protein
MEPRVSATWLESIACKLIPEGVDVHIRHQIFYRLDDFLQNKCLAQFCLEHFAKVKWVLVEIS